jgi:protein SCO1/2
MPSSERIHVLSRRSSFAVVGVIAIFAISGCGGSEPPPVLGALPEFALVDAAGAAVTKGSLGGRPFVADFIFTRCPAACPKLTARMKELAVELPAESRARLVSFSVDPEHDRPEVLAAYVAKWEIDGDRWTFVTGEREAMWTLVRTGFLLPVEEQDDPANPFLHSNRFALVDAAGNLRGTYEAFDEAATDRLLADLAAVEREAAK